MDIPVSSDASRWSVKGIDTLAPESGGANGVRGPDASRSEHERETVFRSYRQCSLVQRT